MKAGFLLVIAAALAAILFVSGVFTPPARHILITDATANPLPNGTTIAVLTIENQGAPDILDHVSSSVGSARFENAARGLPIPSGTSSLAVDAAHIILTASDSTFDDGALIPLTLGFQSAGEVTLKAHFKVPEPGSMAAHMAMGHGMMMLEAAQTPKPTLALSVSEEPSGWRAHIKADNFTFSEDLQDGEHIDGTGHGHIYVGDMKLGRVFSDSYAIGALPPGKHVVRVTLNTNDHRTYTVNGRPLVVETTIEVD